MRTEIRSRGRSDGADTQVLTPRYKGLQLIAAHAPDGLYSVTMSFVCRGETEKVRVEASTAKGGFLCTRPLADADRLIPDLHTVFRGGLHCFTHIKKCDGSKLGEAAESHTVRDAMLDDYGRKDALLAEFARTGRFASRDDYALHQLPIWHLRMNATLIGMAVLSFYTLTIVFGYAAASVLRTAGLCFLSVFLLHAISHCYAESISGASRESLLFETLLKSLMQQWMGGKLDHGGESTAAKARKAAAEAAPLAASSLDANLHAL